MILWSWGPWTTPSIMSPNCFMATFWVRRPAPNFLFWCKLLIDLRIFCCAGLVGNRNTYVTTFGVPSEEWDSGRGRGYILRGCFSKSQQLGATCLSQFFRVSSASMQWHKNTSNFFWLLSRVQSSQISIFNVKLGSNAMSPYFMLISRRSPFCSLVSHGILQLLVQIILANLVAMSSIKCHLEIVLIVIFRKYWGWAPPDVSCQSSALHCTAAHDLRGKYCLCLMRRKQQNNHSSKNLPVSIYIFLMFPNFLHLFSSMEV